MPAKGSYRVSFTVPAGSGSYAPERITFDTATGVARIDLLGVTIAAESLPASATAELWLPKLGVVNPADADYFATGKGVTVAAPTETFSLASYPGAQIRVKSGGTAGTAIVNATAD